MEIYQNCPIFNDGAFDVLKEPGQKEQRLIPLKHGEPIVFGADGDHAVVRTDYGLEVTKTADVDQTEIVVHDATLDDPSYAFALSRLSTQDLGPHRHRDLPQHLPAHLRRRGARAGHPRRRDQPAQPPGAAQRQRHLDGR